VLADPEYSWEGQRLGGYRSLVGVPILVNDVLIGVIGVVRTVPEPFSGDQIQLLRTFADQAAIAIVNAQLLDAVERQRSELSRFVSPQVAELLSSEEGQQLLAGHRAYISVLFADLRGFTAFVETAAPEELFELLREYHALIGELLASHGGTLEHFAGDGVMVFFNDPAPIANHELRAIEMALSLQQRFGTVATAWDRRGMELGLGIGIAAGYATLGRIGFEGRYDYGALGPVTNLASRLSTYAGPGQVLISPHVFAAAENEVEAEPIGEIELKGSSAPFAHTRFRRDAGSSGATLGARGQGCEHLWEVAADLGTDLRAHGLGGRARDLHPIGDARAFVADRFDPVCRADDEVAAVGLVDEKLRLSGFGDV
jgi:class 3 adenylate cyclase